MPPHVSGQLAPGGLLGGDQPWSHVWLAVHRLAVEVVGERILHVHEDRVVLGRPAPPRASTVVVRPDELVEKALAPEHLVEQQLAAVCLAIVDV